MDPKFFRQYSDLLEGVEQLSEDEVYHSMRRLAATAQDVLDTARSLLQSHQRGLSGDPSESRLGLFSSQELDELTRLLEHVDSELMK